MFRTRFEKEIVADTRGAMCGGFFRSYGACSSRVPFTHGLRPFDRLRAGCGLHSAAASRLFHGCAVIRGRLVLGPAQDVIAISSRDQDLNRLFDFAQGRLSRKGREKWGHPALYLIPFITRTSSLLS